MADKTNIKTRGRKFYFSPNIHLRNKAWRYRNKICFTCGKIKRRIRSILFFSDKNKTHWNPKLKRWVTHYQDYIWVCRDCKEKPEIDRRLRLDSAEIERARGHQYGYPK